MISKGLLVAATVIFSGLFAAYQISEEIVRAPLWVEPVVNTVAAICVCGLCCWVLRHRRDTSNHSRA